MTMRFDRRRYALVTRRLSVATTVAIVSIGAHAADTTKPDVAASPAPPPAADRPVDISDPVIRKAIADSRDPMDDITSSAPAAFGNRPATPRQRIDRAFDDAEIPTCLTPDAFRFAPAMIGPFDVAGTPLALPFLVHAIATGKCRH